MKVRQLFSLILKKICLSINYFSDILYKFQVKYITCPQGD